MCPELLSKDLTRYVRTVDSRCTAVYGLTRLIVVNKPLDNKENGSLRRIGVEGREGEANQLIRKET